MQKYEVELIKKSFAYVIVEANSFHEALGKAIPIGDVKDVNINWDEYPSQVKPINMRVYDPNDKSFYVTVERILKEHFNK